MLSTCWLHNLFVGRSSVPALWRMGTDLLPQIKLGNSLSRGTLGFGVSHSSCCHFSDELWENHDVESCIPSALWKENGAGVVTGWGNYLGVVEFLELPLGASDLRGSPAPTWTARTQQISLGSVLPPPSEHSGPPPACAFLLLLHCSQPDPKTLSILTHLNFSVIWEKDCFVSVDGIRQTGS